MSTDIILKHSSTAAKVPLATDLEAGEVAINTADVKAYIKDSTGAVVQLAGPGSGEGEYVKIAGDNMTGDLTLGTDKIDLNASSGSAEFAGSVDADGGFKADGTSFSSPVVIGKLNGTNTSLLRANGDLLIAGDVGNNPNILLSNSGSSFFSGTAGIGGTQAAPNIELNASSGSATFEGNVNVNASFCRVINLKYI